MATISVTPDQDAIVADVQIAVPPERIFKALTDARELPRWFGSSDCALKFWQFDARLDGAYSYEMQPGSIEVNGVREFKCHGRITEYDPPKVLAYTWFGNWHDNTSIATVVRWELTPTRNGTYLKVTHSGLANLPVARKDYSGGWTGVVESLKKFAENS